MKNNDEMYQSLLSRWDEYQEKKKKRLLIFRRVVPVLACLLLVVGIGIGHWRNISDMPPISQQNGIIEASTVTADANTAAELITTDTHTTSFTASTAKTETAEKTVYSSTAVTTVSAAAATNAINGDTATGRTVTQTVAVTRTVTVPSTAKLTATITSFAAPETTKTQIATVSPVVTGTFQPVTGIPHEEPQISEPKDENIPYVLFGYDEGDMSAPIHQKPKSAIKIYMKCKSFCAAGQPLDVDVAMCDESLHFHENLDHIYEYSVYQSDFTSNDLVANNSNGGYVKSYSGEENRVFDVTSNIGNYSFYHHEDTEISFAGYKAGSSGSITFSFLAKYLDINNELPANPSTNGSLQNMYYYVGKKGVGISSKDVEDAKAAYMAVCG